MRLKKTILEELEAYRIPLEEGKKWLKENFTPQEIFLWRLFGYELKEAIELRKKYENPFRILDEMVENYNKKIDKILEKLNKIKK